MPHIRRDDRDQGEKAQQQHDELRHLLAFFAGTSTALNSWPCATRVCLTFQAVSSPATRHHTPAVWGFGCARWGVRPTTGLLCKMMSHVLGREYPFSTCRYRLPCRFSRGTVSGNVKITSVLKLRQNVPYISGLAIPTW